MANHTIPNLSVKHYLWSLFRRTYGNNLLITKMLTMCQKEKFIAKAMAMRGTLLSILREFGFFKREIERVQEKPTEFLPYRQVRSEERKR